MYQSKINRAIRFDRDTIITPFNGGQCIELHPCDMYISGEIVMNGSLYYILTLDTNNIYSEKREGREQKIQNWMMFFISPNDVELLPISIPFGR